MHPTTTMTTIAIMNLNAPSASAELENTNISDTPIFTFFSYLPI